MTHRGVALNRIPPRFTFAQPRVFGARRELVVRIIGSICLIWALAHTPALSAVTLRYALVVGSNVGVDADAGHLPPLRHAEREAQQLRDALVRFGGFDHAEGRLVLLLHPTKADLERALRDLAARIHADRRDLDDARIMFSLFFTGHGLNERLLLGDGPVYARELASWLSLIRADFTLTMLDACFSGSLAMFAKGARPAPGLNLFREMPREVLQAEGNMWLVSSAPDEVSYEDQEIGGVFTHFFTEALGRAPADGPGVTLEHIWNYARRETKIYTTARDREQSPQQIVRQLKSTAPIYFSFPTQRDAKLVLSRRVEGRFVLAYGGGHVSDMALKQPGSEIELAVYPGEATLILLHGGRRFEQAVELRAGAVTRIDHTEEHLPSVSFTQSMKPLWKKGFGDQQLRANLIAPYAQLSFGTGYRWSAFERGLLAPRHLLVVRGSMEIDHYVFGISVNAGADGERFDSWSYTATAYGLGAHAGHAWDVGPGKLTALAGVDVWRVEQKFDDASTRTSVAYTPYLGVSYLFPLASWLALSADVETGLVFANGAGARAPTQLNSPALRAGFGPVITF